MGLFARKDITALEIIDITCRFDRANSYLLVDPDTRDAAITDPGGDAPELIRAIRTNAVNVTSILLTHGHFDHILALGEIKEYTHAPVCIHRLDASCLTNPAFSMMGLIGRDDRFDDADILLDDGDKISIGSLDVRVMHTPGHTVGSVCYLTDAGIISGDTLFYESIGRTDFPGGSFSSIKASITALYALEGDMKVYPGHGCETTLEHERRFNPYVNAR